MPQEKQGKLLIFCAPSGAGKSTLVRHLLQLDLGLKFSISCTSRQPREGEKDGREYYFISPEEFRQRAQAGDFVEWEEVYHEQYYGTLRSEVERIRDSGHHALFDIDVMGGLNLKKAYGEHALAIFVEPPSLAVLEERLRGRGTDSEASLQKRLDKAVHEMSFAGQFDRVLVNDILETALGEAEVLVRDFLETGERK